MLRLIVRLLLYFKLQILSIFFRCSSWQGFIQWKSADTILSHSKIEIHGMQNTDFIFTLQCITKNSPETPPTSTISPSVNRWGKPNLFTYRKQMSTRICTCALWERFAADTFSHGYLFILYFLGLPDRTSSRCANAQGCNSRFSDQLMVDRITIIKPDIMFILEILCLVLSPCDLTFGGGEALNVELKQSQASALNGRDGYPSVPPGFLRLGLQAEWWFGDTGFTNWSCTFPCYSVGRPREGCHLLPYLIGSHVHDFFPSNTWLYHHISDLPTLHIFHHEH